MASAALPTVAARDAVHVAVAATAGMGCRDSFPFLAPRHKQPVPCLDTCGTISPMADVSLYIDSSVWNCSFNEHVPDFQAQTRSFFDRVRSDPAIRPYLSDVVLQELGGAPAARAPLLAELVRTVNPIRLDLDEESNSLAEAYVAHGALSVGHLVDGRHVAIATVARLEALVSWNYKHLVNRRRREAFNGVNAIMGYRSLDIVSPPEVFDD